ncbi:hypothetical protein [Moorena sp. SIO2C4]|nr:hypothetical protein [Moorena sp. SIO2C4]
MIAKISQLSIQRFAIHSYLLPAPCSLLPAPCSMLHAPCSLLPAP